MRRLLVVLVAVGGIAAAAACADLGPFDVTLCNPIDSVIFSPDGDTLRVYQTPRCQ